MAEKKNILSKGSEQIYHEGELIFKEGDKTKELYFILSGEVQIVKSVHGENLVLASLHTGEFFGEMSAFTNQPRVANALASQNTSLMIVHPGSFQSLIENQSEFGLRVVKTLCKRLKEADQQIEDLIIQNQVEQVIQIIRHEATGGGKGSEIIKDEFTYGAIFQKIVDKTDFRRDIIIKLLDLLSKKKIIFISKEKASVLVQVTKKIIKKPKEK